MIVHARGIFVKMSYTPCWLFLVLFAACGGTLRRESGGPGARPLRFPCRPSGGGGRRKRGHSPRSPSQGVATPCIPAKKGVQGAGEAPRWGRGGVPLGVNLRGAGFSLPGCGVSPHTSFLPFRRRRRHKKGSAEGNPLLKLTPMGGVPQTSFSLLNVPPQAAKRTRKSQHGV